ncbi:MAG: DUF2569 domain-containing protein [Aliidiomarina sp.]|uniref:DUF2569 domain-containing protein n=1 Tax=Aliidiomarina sp. TaxID=1872439 RepID=UPI0025BD0383|nr:DUF2569 domain-containing protein [Aliidiomarina sp.]MCH8500443.1 DUF2569 domain-containing protein [Aliidiomarina sp.]
MADEKEVKGLGGWLLLLALGLFLTPIRLLSVDLPMFNALLSSIDVEQFTTPGSEFYHPWWLTIVRFEMFYHFAMLIASLYLIYLFFSKHHWFPRVYITVLSVSIVYVLVDSWMVSLLFGEQPLVERATWIDLVRLLITACIWIPYLLLSKRVQNTFVEGKKSSVE